MAREEEEEEEESGVPGWMMTFSDLMSLLLTFFVLLYSMSTVKVQAWDKIAHSVEVTLIPHEKREVDHVSVPIVSSVARKAASSLGYIESVLRETFRREEVDLTMKRDKDYLAIILGGDRVQRKRYTSLSKKDEQRVRLLANVLKRVENAIYVVAFEDSRHPVEKSIRKNRELSLMHAVDVSNFLRANGYKRVIQIGGMGSDVATVQVDESLEKKEKLKTRVEVRISRFKHI